MTAKEIYNFLDDVFIKYCNGDLATTQAINKIASKMIEIVNEKEEKK